MAGRKRKKPRNDEPFDVGGQLRLIANLLGLLLTKDMGEGEKVGTLSAVGFRNLEIARLLGKEEKAVGVALIRHRGKRKTKRGRSARASD